MYSDVFESSDKTERGKPKISPVAGYVLITVTGGIGTALLIACAPFVSPALRKICLPYVPATTVQVENVLSALRGRSGNLIDVGSGDGRIVLAAARKGFKADGVELNPWLIAYSKIKAATQGLASKTAFFRRDLWKFNLTKYDNIVIFGVEQMMTEIEEKFISELRKDSVVVVCRFPLPNLKPVSMQGQGVDTVWVYKIDK
ncbi:protein FAM173B isoform X2 [Orussus abietinus]|nr:protein FAM173B isoform X2 [Orussus abietinus]XP_012283998.1 protein FAM173B isoform X2 [Orussus abietinus]